MSYAIGIDLGGTSIKSVAVTGKGKLLAQARQEFDAGEPMKWAEKVRDIVAQIQSEQGAFANWIGLSAPGVAARDGMSIAHLPGRLKGLENLNWTKFLQSKKPVPVLNDAHSALLGESWLGAARGFQNVILLTLGTGVGGAILIEGKLLRGATGRAGHLGHTCLNPKGSADIVGMPGSLENEIGNCTIAERSKGRFLTTHDLMSAHVAGDAGATDIWLTSVHALACAIASFINILDPEVVIIGGGISQGGAALFDPLEKYLDEMEWRPGGHRAKIVPAVLGDFSGALGAAHHAIRQTGMKTGSGEWRVDFVPFIHRTE